MVVIVRDVIFLGTFADADTNEGTPTVENTAIYEQNFGSIGDPLQDHITSLSFDDQDNDGGIATDNFSGLETVTLGGGGTVLVDSLAVVSGVVTYADGTTQSVSNVVMFQTDDGGLYLANSSFAGTDLRRPGDPEIRSFNVSPGIDTNYVGLFANVFQDFACYVAGTLIKTPRGEQLIEDLAVGDLIETLDHGAQPIRWIGQSQVRNAGPMTPVRIKQGALGPGQPRDDLWVSQQHRILIGSRIVGRIVGCEEALVAAKALLPVAGVALAHEPKQVTYLHLLCDRHEVIFANGCPSETLLPGQEAMRKVGPEARAELRAILPELATSSESPCSARQLLEGSKRKSVVRRHLKHQRPFVTHAA